MLRGFSYIHDHHDRQAVIYIPSDGIVVYIEIVDETETVAQNSRGAGGGEEEEEEGGGVCCNEGNRRGAADNRPVCVTRCCWRSQ